VHGLVTPFSVMVHAPAARLTPWPMSTLPFGSRTAFVVLSGC
jgi:hypothetical protein